MIGRQLKVYLHPEDHVEIDNFVRNDLNCVLLAERSPSSVSLELHSSRETSATGSLICPAALVGNLSLRGLANRKEWVIELGANPVIEWWYSKLDGDELHPGRFYYIPMRSIDGVAYEKDDAFLDVATRLFAWIRRTTIYVATEWGRERLGTEAADRFRDGTLGLRRNPPGSR